MNNTLCFMCTYVHVLLYILCVILLVSFMESYAVIRHISMLFIDNEDYVFCILFFVCCFWLLLLFCLFFGGGGGGGENGRRRGERHFACQT